MNRYIRTLPVLALTGFTLFACKKSLTDPSANQEPISGAYPVTPHAGCATAPDYGDTIIYPQPGGNYKVKPKNPAKGLYLSWPQGLVLDRVSGEINVSKSQTGMRYAIGFVSDGSKDTCITKLIIAGVSYQDGVYNTAAGDSLLAPNFNASATPSNMCNTPGACNFAEQPTTPPIITGFSKKLAIDKATGVINLAQTLRNNIFGGNPKNGDDKVLEVMYSLDDNSKKATQKLKLKFVYYDKASNVPTSLTNQLQQMLSLFVNGDPLTLVNSPRPPQIIITKAF